MAAAAGAGAPPPPPPGGGGFGPLLLGFTQSDLDREREVGDITDLEILNSGINGRVFGDGIVLANIEKQQGFQQFYNLNAPHYYRGIQITPREFDPDNHGDFRILNDEYDFSRPRHVRVLRRQGTDYMGLDNFDRQAILHHVESNKAVQNGILGPIWDRKPKEALRLIHSPFAQDDIEYDIYATPFMRKAYQGYNNERKRITSKQSGFVPMSVGRQGLVSGDFWSDFAGSREEQYEAFQLYQAGGLMAEPLPPGAFGPEAGGGAAPARREEEGED